MASRTHTYNDVLTELRGLGKHRWDALLEISREGGSDGIGVALLAAIAARETNISNIVGDGGHGRSLFQIDDRAWRSWLSSVPGVKSGTWDHYDGHSAAYPGHCPSMTRAAGKAITILRSNKFAAKNAGVPPALQVKVAVAGYNCGMGNALAAYRRYGARGIDEYTTGNDYSSDVFEIKDLVVQAAKHLGWDL